MGYRGFDIPVPKFDPLEGFSTYSEDVPLLEKLGLKTFSAKTWDKIYLGKVENDIGFVHVWVMGAPAQFWTFEIHIKDTVTKISTGSGRFGDYWKFAEAILNNMIVIKRAESFIPQTDFSVEEEDVLS